jgi:hypothetical protein
MLLSITLLLFNIAMENAHRCFLMIYLSKMVILHGYFK